MENKKGNLGSIPNNEALGNEAIPKHIHNTAPQHLRLLQYGLKIPNHQHSQLNQPSLHQHPSRPVTPHLHQHQHQSQPVYQSLPSHLQHSPHQHQPPTLNIYQNQTFQQIPHHHQSNLQSQSPLPNNYYYQNTNQPPLHIYNLNNQNAQVWVPHQPPEHYHPQQQKSEPQVLQNANTNQTSQQHKPKEVERKKTYTITYHQQLRSPSAKRPMEAPVTIQGWLHKQGSDGLMLWKKRWFVLSEYCLFYYKGAEEEKLLGSILLPSYKVSVCGPDDKVNRKFAFKCEHVNMRTYILSADSQDLMMQWVRNLNMACLLQNTSEPEGYLSTTSTPVESVNERQQQQPIQPQNLRNTPIHIHSSSNTTDLSNPSQQELSQYSQPLYANAPPKPRRLTDGYSSPSSDILEKHLNESKYVTLQQPNHNQYNMHTVYIPRNSTKSPINIYGNPQMHLEYLHQTSPQMMYNKRFHVPEYGANMVGGRENQNSERRTPDTYGRSKLSLSKGSHPSDYEDVYAEQSMYKRPLSPVAYTTNRLNTGVRPYTPVIMRNSKDNLAYTPLQQLKKFPNTIPRPHSADFLEYEVKNQLPIVISRQPRPKSSLDINRHTTNDNYFYSEESYAEKMRKSAQYLPKMSKYSDGNIENEIRHQKRPTSSNKYESETNFHVPRPNSRPTNFNEDYHQLHVHPVRSRSVLSDGSISKELDIDLQNNMHGENFNKESASFRNKQELYGYSGERKANREYDQFTRSASARLAQTSGQYEGRPGSHDGERKREESMKRLLEWKQRMLQSPLNRKVNQSLNKNVASKFNPYYRTSENPYPQTSTNEVYPDGRRSANPLPQYNSYSSDDEASGSISITTRDTFPRSIVTKKVWAPPNTRPEQSKSTTNLARGYENDYPVQTQSYTMSQGPSQQDLSSDTSQSSGQRRVNFQLGDKMNVSAGELLGRTHEELVLLLIQLRRQSANNLNSIETSYIEIDNIQAQLPKMDAAKRLENLQKLEQIKQHLLELEKQYEKGKPLVNLVDNMVKLGSLYKFPKDHSNYPYVKDRLEFNQQIQERRLLAEEKRDWNRLTSNHSELQVKVQQLYQLDNLIQEESETLLGLQHDKEEIERALGGLRFRLIKGFKDPAEIEQARKQQIVLENELSRVHSMLAQNSRKLEETVAGNARLEQELLVLKQKLQISRQHRNSPQISNAGDSLPCVIGTSAMLESDLHRVQQKVGDLHRQRQELSMQVKQLTDRSNNLQQMRLSSMVPAQILVGNKKKVTSSWRETDLDSMRTPLYINTNLKQNQENDLYSSSIKSSDSVSDDAIQNLIPQEKQEIKTVRIVKRESERRQRDREKTTVTGKWDTVVEEDDLSQNSNFRSVPVQKTHSSTNLEVNNCDMDTSSSGVLSRQSSISNPSLLNASSNASSIEGGLEKSCKLSPVFKSEAAKQIIIEMSTTQDPPKKSHRRAVPKERRRHHTAPHNNLIMKSLNQLPTTDKDFDTTDLNVRRARDDLDMERALRQRIDAPDVVRSTLSNKELKYNENTIDNILGTPNKILIPERYVPEQLPQLTVEEQQYRLRKVESIKKMLSDTAIISGSSVNLASDEIPSENVLSNVTNMTSCKIMEEKKQRQHLLQLNQILAKQVMEMSKIVAGSTSPDD